MMESVSAVSGHPMGDRAVDLASRDFTIEGRPSEDARATANACFRVISPDYFRTMGARILQGRNFSERDGRHAPRVTVINQTMAREFWPSGDAVGHRIYLGRQYGRPDVCACTGLDERPLAIVGVISDVRQTRVVDAPVREEFHVALAQQTNPPRIMTFLARSTMDPAKLTE